VIVKDLLVIAFSIPSVVFFLIGIIFEKKDSPKYDLPHHHLSTAQLLATAKKSP
jgi:hypothetical protein